MKLGFVSATVLDLSLEEVTGFASAEGCGCVEVESRACEGPLEDRKPSLRRYATFLRQYVPAGEVL